MCGWYQNIYKERLERQHSFFPNLSNLLNYFAILILYFLKPRQAPLDNILTFYYFQLETVSAVYSIQNALTPHYECIGAEKIYLGVLPTHG